MKQTRTILILASLVLLIGISSCGSKSKSSAPPAPTPTATPPGVCTTDQIWSAQHNSCLQLCPGQPGYGVDPSSHQCISVVGTTINTNNTWGGDLIITDQGLYRNFLQEYGQICDLYQYNWGSSSCDQWDSRAKLQIYSFGTALPAFGSVSLFAYSDYGFNYYYNLRMDGQFDPINNNTGFEMRQMGYYGSPSYNSTIRVFADPGLLTDSQIHVYLYYKGSEFARVELRKF